MKFDQVVFAGGGNRCWWQAGFWHALNEDQAQNPQRITAISAGAATACLLYARPGRAGVYEALDYYNHVLANVTQNAYWKNLFNEQKVFPHQQIYSSALAYILQNAPSNLMSAPDMWIGVAHIPKFLGPTVSVAMGLMAYNFEKHVLKTLHPKLGRLLGFSREFIRAQDCQNLDQLIELILQSSCTPPFTPVMYRDGRAVLDGGLVDNVPIDGLLANPPSKPPSEVLVLVTRRYPLPDVFVKNLPGLRLTYVQPSRTVPISSWDYSHRELMEPTYLQGVEDARRILETGTLAALQHNKF